MNNYQTQVLRAQINLLWHIRENNENDLTTDQVWWIDKAITYVEVKYLNDPNDSGLADEYRAEEPKQIDFLQALDLLTVRINNTMEYLGSINDPDQVSPNEKGIIKTNIKFSYLYRDSANYKNHHEVIFENPNQLELSDINSIIRDKLMDGEWFYASKWNLKDLHFDRWDEEIDHIFHEFESIEITNEKATEPITIDKFLEHISLRRTSYLA